MLRAPALVLGVLLVAACGGGSGGTPVAARGALQTPNPLTVQPASDAARAAGSSIGPSGGRLTATAANGASITIVIPAGALLSAHTITLTPLTSMGGMPLSGGLLAGVQLGPEGLLLAKPATLTITLAASGAGGRKVFGFGFRRAGAEFHLAPASGGGAAYSLRIWHFSGAGVAAGTAADASSFAAEHPPTAPADQVEQAQAVGQGAIAILTGWDATLSAQIGGQVDLAEFDLIYQQTMTFDAMATLAGRPDLAQQIYTKLALALKTAAQLALTRCRNDPDAGQGLRVIRWIEWAQLHPSILANLDVSFLEGEVLKCLRFRLDFTTTVDTTFGPESVDLSVEVKDVPLNAIMAVPLKFAPGTGDIKYTAFKWITPGAIPYTVAFTVTRPFTAEDILMNLDAFDYGGAAALVEGMSVTVDFGDTVETITVQFPYPINLPLKSFYANGMQNAHHSDMVGPNLYSITPWTPGSGGGVFAEAHQGCPCPSPGPMLTYTQDTLFQLRHTPQ